MDIYLVRHGETEWNREAVFRGTADIPLNRQGLAQARAVGRCLRGLPLAAVFSSPLSRARATAEAIARYHRLPVELDPGLGDLSFGEWQGLSRYKVKQRYPELYRRWLDHPERVRFPGGEDLASVLSRALAVVDRLLGGTAEAAVLVSHRVVLKLLITHALGLGPAGFWRVTVDPAGVSLLAGSSLADLRVRMMNDTCHLRRLSLAGDF